MHLLTANITMANLFYSVSVLSTSMHKAFSEKKKIKKHFSNILIGSFAQLFLSVIQVTTSVYFKSKG